MRIRRALLVLPLVVLVACGSKAVAVDTNPTGPVYGPATPAATVAVLAAPAEMPTATGVFGEKPTLTFPATPPPKLQELVLSAGTGGEVKKGDTLVANYYGAVWGSQTPFDSSYDKGAPASFPIGVGSVVSGWDVALVGQQVGSRVLLSLSSSDGYGLAGGANGQIKSGDTIVFVVDILASLSMSQLGQADAEVQPAPADSPVVTGAPGQIPTLTVPAGLAEPTAPRLDILAKGTGAPVVLGHVFLQYAAYDWTGVQKGATWDSSGPQDVELTADLVQLQGLIGVPVGSRILLQLPADATNNQPASAFVMDVVYQAPVKA